MQISKWRLFAWIFGVTTVAELPDKTAIATVMMAAHENPLGVFAGVSTAFVIQNIVAVAFGGFIGMLPAKWVHMGAGLLFIIMGIFMWLRKDSESGQGKTATDIKGFWKSAQTSFWVIFVAEWGDLTQISTAAFAAKYEQDVMLVFSAATLSLWFVTALAVFVGVRAKKFMNLNLLKKVGAVLFALIGLAFIIKSY